MNVARFAFPLNVYARMLELDEGRLDYLHYGLFESDHEPVWKAQERATEQVWRALPPPCRVLEVGIGVGTTLRRLLHAGYQAMGITPDAAQIEEVRARLGDAANLRQSTLEDLEAQHGPFDLMLLQESAQYIAPLSLFEAADRLLTPTSAAMVVIDEFALTRRGVTDVGLHDYDAFVALARRMGWVLTAEQDLSAAASGTVDAIGRLVRRQREALLRDLPVTADQLDTLVEAGQRYKALYESGVYGYRLMRLERKHRPVLRLGTVGTNEASAMRGLFERVFGHPMSEAEWLWKYGNGRGHAVGLWRDDGLVAHYACTTRSIRTGDDIVQACQVGDVMVLPDANAGLGRHGALMQVSATLLEQQIGWGRPHLIGYGFPNERAMRVAHRLALYEPVDRVLQLEWQGPPVPRWQDRLTAVEQIDVQRMHVGEPAWQRLDELWASMHRGLPDVLVPVRDPAWLRHRYGCRPGVQYQLHLVRRRWGGQSLGAFVLRMHDDHAELMDVLGPPTAFFRLVRMARRVAMEVGRPMVRTWMTASQVKWLDDPVDPPRRSELGVEVPTCVHTPGPAPEALRGRWFLMSGDTDFR